MRKLYYYDNVHQRRRKQQQQQQQLIDCNNRDNCGGGGGGVDNGKHRRFKEIGAVFAKYAATKSDEHDENFDSQLHSHIDGNRHSQQQHKQFTQLTKCAKMSEENGMIKNGNLNGVGIARSISQNLTNFSNFTISPSTTTTPPPPLSLPLPASTTTTTTASTSTSTSNGTGGDKQSTANATSPPNGHNGGGGGGGGGGSGAGGGGDTSNSDFGDQKPANTNNGSVAAHPNALGGRLQFFKDGKFILELARSKEDGRGGWVSVPRKTYWPPAAPSSNNNSVNHNKNESSTSLSFSDDNSSIQSSPWQRDHCWKQLTPRRNISKELCLYYWRPAAIVLHAKCLRISKLKSRRPHETKLLANQRVEYAKRTSSKASTSTKIDESKEKAAAAVKKEEETSVDVVDSAKLNESNDEENVDEKKSTTTARVDEVSDENEMAVDCEKSEEKLPTKSTALKRPKLNDILQKLIDKLAEQPQNVVGMQTGPGAGALLSSGNGTTRSSDLGYYQQHVSPRKRILREFEKVSLEDAANTSSTKRSRSKGCANAPASSANGSRTIDGSPKTTQSSTLYPIGQSNVTPTTSRPISSYSITSLLGHNSSSGNSNSTAKLDNGQRTSPKSPPQPSTGRMPKKKSPINGSTSVGSPVGLTSSSFGSHRSPMNSPVNYGGRSTRSPDLNSPSPDHHHSMRNHAQRYAFGSTAASISSPTSGFHPYLPTSRASPLSSSTGALSPNTLDRYRANYRAAASPTGTSSSSVSGPSHAYASANGSPNAHMMRYSPSTYGGSAAQTTSPQQKSSPYHINSLLPHAADTSNGNAPVCRNIDHDQAKTEASPRTTKAPAATTTSTTSTSNNNTPTRTIPKKTASLRQQFGSSLSPSESKATENRSLSPESMHKHQPPMPRFTAAELEHHQAYLAAAAMHSRNASSPPTLPPSAQSSPLHPFYMPYGAPPTHPNAANVSQSMAAMAAYLNPLYYHPMTYSNPFRSQFWMPYQTAPNSNPLPADPKYGPLRNVPYPYKTYSESPKCASNMAAAGNSIPFHSRSPPADAPVDPAPWMGSLHSTSPPKTAFQRQTTRPGSEYDTFHAMREEQNSDVPLNLSKH